MGGRGGADGPALVRYKVRADGPAFVRYKGRAERASMIRRPPGQALRGANRVESLDRLPGRVDAADRRAAAAA